METVVNVVVQRDESRVVNNAPHTLRVTLSPARLVSINIESGFGYSYALLTKKQAIEFATLILSTVAGEVNDGS